jgi:hypothetical protein
MIFVIVKTGVYQHGVFGAFQDLEWAKKTAKSLADYEPDAVHSFDVVKVADNSPPRIQFFEDFGIESLPEEVIFSVNKDGVLKEQNV